MSTPVLISLRPQFADLVFDGHKLAEFRRRFATITEERDVYVYVTSPQMVLRGGFCVDRVWRGSPEEVWRSVSTLAGIRRDDFDAYYEGATTAYALGITDVWEFRQPIDVRTLKDQLGGFVVPQSWRYVKPEERKVFKKMARRGISTPARALQQ